jgi:hypothetical protein
MRREWRLIVNESSDYPVMLKEAKSVELEDI